MLRLSEIRQVTEFNIHMRNAGVPERQACFGIPGATLYLMERDRHYRDIVLQEMSEEQNRYDLLREITNLVERYANSKIQ